MPVLPTFESKRNIEANPASPQLTGAEQPYQDQQHVVNTLQDITQKWSDANDVMQYTKAKSDFEIQSALIEEKAKNDPNINNAPIYNSEIEKAKSDSLKGISNAAVAKKLSGELGYSSTVSKIKIDSYTRAKQLAENKITFKNSIDTLEQKRLSAATPNESNQYDLQIKELISSQLQAGLITPEEADKELKDSQETAVKYLIYNDSSVDEKDSSLLKELKKPNGEFSYLSPETRLKMIEESQRRIFQNNQTFKKENEISKNDRFQNIFQKANDGTLTLTDLDAEQKAADSGDPGALGQKEILDIRKSLQSRIKTDLEVIVKNNEKAADYFTFINNFISDETDRQKGRELIVQAFKDGILSPKEAALLNSLKRETEDISNLKNREAFMSNNLIPFKNAINSVNDFFTGKKNFTETEKAMAIKELLNSSSDGKSPEEAQKDIINKNIIKKNPRILNLSDEGQLVVDDNGYIRIMNNKGEYKESGK